LAEMSTDHRGRPRLEPDPQVRATILAAALEIVHDKGVHGWGVAELLDRTHLSTRAFYRHFDSKDQLVAAMFLEVARVEAERLQQGMADEDPVRAVVAWIDGRLDLAFDLQVESNSRQLALEAHTQIFTSPELVGPAYLEILRPLIGQIDRGTRLGLFSNGHPVEEAMSIDSVVWANLLRQWATGTCGLGELRRRVLRFCLRGLGVADDVIAEVIADGDICKSQLNKSIAPAHGRAFAVCDEHGWDPTKH